jgi:hypothetical protein
MVSKDSIEGYMRKKKKKKKKKARWDLGLLKSKKLTSAVNFSSGLLTFWCMAILLTDVKPLLTLLLILVNRAPEQDLAFSIQFLFYSRKSISGRNINHYLTTLPFLRFFFKSKLTIKFRATKPERDK